MASMYFSFPPSISPSYSSPSTSSSISSLYHISPTSPHRFSDASTASCAFPSWPRRPSLNSRSSSMSSDGTADANERAFIGAEVTNYVSDDDLFPDVFEDSESDCTPVTSPCGSPPALIMSPRESIATVGSLLGMSTSAQHKGKGKKEKRPKNSRKRSSVGKGKAMSPILEGGE